MKKNILYIIVLMIFILSDNTVSAKDWTDSKRIIHATGGINNTPYTNSLDALKKTIKRGEKIVEIDFTFTKDGVLVCNHACQNKITLKKFQSKKVNGIYTPLTANEAIKRLVKAGNIYLVVDAKDADIKRVYKELNDLCVKQGSKGKAYRKMIIPQLYKKSDYKKVKSVYPYKNYIFTMYKLIKTTPIESCVNGVIKFCKKNGISVLTIEKAKVTSEIVEKANAAGIKVATHTVNDYSEYEYFKNMGVDIIYTDFLTR